MKLLNKAMLPTALSVIITTLTVGMIVFAAPWADPTATPPGNNAPTPINISEVGQVKEGGLILNTGGASMGLIIQGGSVGIGDASADNGLKLDVAGKVGATEYCDQDGNNCHAAAGGGGSEWPVGSYCIMKNGACPSGFTAKTLSSSVARPEWTDSYGNASISSAGSSSFGADYYGNVHYHAYRMDLAFCCK